MLPIGTTPTYGPSGYLLDIHVPWRMAPPVVSCTPTPAQHLELAAQRSPQIRPWVWRLPRDGGCVECLGPCFCHLAL